MTARHELVTRHDSVLDALKTLRERHVDAVLRSVTRKIFFYIYLAENLHRADIFSEGCASAMAWPFGVTAFKNNNCVHYSGASA